MLYSIFNNLYTQTQGSDIYLHDLTCTCIFKHKETIFISNLLELYIQTEGNYLYSVLIQY